MKQLAILISNAGSGTNLQAIINGIQKGVIHANIAVVVSDAPDAYGLVRAKEHNISTYIFTKGESLENILQKQYNVDYVVLAGWKQIIPDSFIDAFPNRILNIHPGLIPGSPDSTVKNPDGTDGLWNRGKFTTAAIQNFIDKKADYAGSTVHFLSKEFDFGPVLARCFEKIQSDDTVETLYARLKKKENEMYVKALKTLCKNSYGEK